MQFKIAEFDKDYHTVTNVEEMEFPSQEEADKYCREKSWSGYSYDAYPIDEIPDREIDGYPAWLS